MVGDFSGLEEETLGPFELCELGIVSFQPGNFNFSPFGICWVICALAWQSLPIFLCCDWGGFWRTWAVFPEADIQITAGGPVSFTLEERIMHESLALS